MNRLVILLASAGWLSSSPTFAASIDLSTPGSGAFSSWSFIMPYQAGGSVSGPTGPLSGSTVAYASSFPNNTSSSWQGLPNTGLAYWLGATSLTFSTVFSLSGTYPGTALLSGGWAVDGSAFGAMTATLSLNATVIGEVSDFTSLSTGLTDLSAPSDAFVPGLNTISIAFSLNNAYGAAAFDSDAIRVQAVVTANDIPEPAPWMVPVIMGFGLLLMISRQRPAPT